MAEDVEAPVFKTVAFTTPPKLSQANVAIVTSASLHHADQEDFAPNDAGVRV